MRFFSNLRMNKNIPVKKEVENCVLGFILLKNSRFKYIKTVWSIELDVAIQKDHYYVADTEVFFTIFTFLTDYGHFFVGQP